MVEFRKKRSPPPQEIGKQELFGSRGNGLSAPLYYHGAGWKSSPFFLSALPRERGRGGLISPPPWAGGWVPCAALAAPGRLADEEGGKGEWRVCRSGQVSFSPSEIIQNRLFCIAPAKAWSRNDTKRPILYSFCPPGPGRRAAARLVCSNP